MNKYSFWGGCIISSCSLNESTIIFKELERHVYQCIYDDLPDNTIGEKIRKQRILHHIKRNELARLINCHIDTVESWENDGVIPKPYNIEKMCTLFNVQAGYFHKYYEILNTNYAEKILTYKSQKQLSYPQLSCILGISESALKRIISYKLHLSFSFFKKLNDKCIL